MSNRHHIYNFHIGFWSAFLISLVVIIQSALFLFVSSGISMAATNVAALTITINSPTAGERRDVGPNININATTTNPGAFKTKFQIYQVIDTNNRVLLETLPDVLSTNGQGVIWDNTWLTSNVAEGDYEIEIEALNGTTGVWENSAPLLIHLGPLALTIDLTQPLNPITVDPLTVFEADTQGLSPDSVGFILTAVGSITPLPAITGRSTDGKLWTSTPYSDWVDPIVYPPGEYLLQAQASIAGTVPVLSTQMPTITIPQDATAPASEILITAPANGATLPPAGGPTLATFKATTNYVANSIEFQISGLDSTGNNITPIIFGGSSGGLANGIYTWTATYDVSTIPNNSPNSPYSLLASEKLADGTTSNVPAAISSITINNPTSTVPDLVITTQSLLPDGTLGQDYLDANGNAVTLDATGGGDGIVAPTYEWTITDLTNFAPGLSVNFATGVISGTPTTARSYTFNVQVSDKINTPVQKSFSINVIDPNPPADATTPSFVNPVSMPGLVSPLPDVKEGDSYSQTLKCQGGSAVNTTYSSSNKPGWLTLDTNTGDLGGSPPAGTISGTADSVILSFTVQCQNGNDTASQLTSIKVTKVAAPPPVPGVEATLELSVPNAPVSNGVLTFKGNNIEIIITANEAVAIPTVMLVQNGRDVISRTASPPSSTDATSQNWTYILNSNDYPNGNYEFRAQARAQDDNELVVATSLNVKIDNAAPADDAGPVYEGGTITSPGEGKGLSGKILMSANITGAITNVTFKVETAKDGTKVVPAKQSTTDKKKWSVVWNSAGIQAGPVTLRAEVVDDAGNVHVLLKVNFNLVAETVALEPETITTADTTAEPAIEEVVAPEIVPNITDQGLIAETPVECQIVGITVQSECDEYLKTREIRLLNEQEQQKVQADLTDIVTHYIELGGGIAISVDPTADQQTGQKVIEDPLADILPIDKDATTGTTVLVVTSTEVPDNLKPFVEQTVPAVLVFDKDGDGLSDETEIRLGTDPNNPDSDGDGFTDGEEIKNGYNPLGAGRFGQVLAPVELAILNNRPLDQPKFAGRIDDENINVGQVKTEDDPAGGGGKIIKLSGQAEPNSFVTLYIYSSLPIVISVKADESGNWEYDLTHPLVDGKHDVYATVTNDTGKIIKKSRAFSFFVQSASAVSEEEFLRASIDIQDASGLFMIYYMLGGILIVLLGGGMFIYYIKQQKSFT